MRVSTSHPISKQCARCGLQWPGSSSTTPSSEKTVRQLGIVLQHPGSYSAVSATYQVTRRGGLGATALLHLVECSISPVYLDANVTCSSSALESGIQQCGVEAVRRMPPTSAYGVSNATMLNFDNFTSTAGMVTGLQTSTGNSGDSGSSTVAEMYMQDPAGLLFGGPRELANLSAVPVELFQERLGLLLNTFFQSNIHLESYFGRQPAYVYSWGELLNVSASTTTPLLLPVYEISRPWITVYLFAAAVLFLAALVTILLRRRCSAPQILGCVNSLVRDSTHFTQAGSAGHSTESGLEIAARLGGVKVSVADFKAEKVGKIACVPAGNGERIKTRRWYD
jgi:hypothetical protein